MRKVIVGFVAAATFLLPIGFVGTADAAPCKVANVLKKTICL